MKYTKQIDAQMPADSLRRVMNNLRTYCLSESDKSLASDLPTTMLACSLSGVGSNSGWFAQHWLPLEQWTIGLSPPFSIGRGSAAAMNGFRIRQCSIPSQTRMNGG
jgi:hypothetical protein